ncbi:MAG: Ribosomal RNA small subunit methyltransferase E [Bacteroidetes bacterium MED-G17]|nr:MAG: Ribosomal RNA small subunit methyltransferase E [Bacteroidetes bacterium MED-G17]
MLTINEFLVNEFIGTLCIAHCQGSDKTSISNIKWQKNEPITIMIGPEGDFTPKEIHLAEQKGFKSISLGSSRLRTETAALFAVTCVYAHFS